MKHDTRLRIAHPTSVAEIEIRAHTPDPLQCAGCHHREGDCSRLAFADMPLVEVFKDGIAFVSCTQFDFSDLYEDSTEIF